MIRISIRTSPNRSEYKIAVHMLGGDSVLLGFDSDTDSYLIVQAQTTRLLSRKFLFVSLTNRTTHSRTHQWNEVVTPE